MCFVLWKKGSLCFIVWKAYRLYDFKLYSYISASTESGGFFFLVFNEVLLGVCVYFSVKLVLCVHANNSVQTEALDGCVF
jgi:hypothetical protein